MELFDQQLILILELFARGLLKYRDLREYLAHKLFLESAKHSLDYMLVDEIEFALAEYDNGHCSIKEVRKTAAELTKKAIDVMEKVAEISQEPFVLPETALALA